MEENKDFLNTEAVPTEAAEAEAAETADAAAEVLPEAPAGEQEEGLEAAGGAEYDPFEDGFEGEPEGAQEADSELTQAEPPKKKRLIMKTIVISAVIVCVTLIATLVFALFFNNGITGQWHLVYTYNVISNDATEDEASTVDVDYIFDFKGDNTVTATVGTVTGKGTYQYFKNDDGNMVMTLDLLDPATQNSFYSGEFTAKTEGNIFTGRTLSLTVPDVSDFEYKFDKKMPDAPKLDKPEKAETNEGLTGTWVFKNELMTYTYTFNDDNTAVFNIKGMTFNQYTYSTANVDLTFNCVYTCDNSSAKLTYFFTEPVDMEVTYKIKDKNTIIIGNNEFVREGTSTADSAE